MIKVNKCFLIVLLSLLGGLSFFSQANASKLKGFCVRALDVEKFQALARKAQQNSDMLDCAKVTDTGKDACKNDSTSVACACRRLKQAVS